MDLAFTSPTPRPPSPAPPTPALSNPAAASRSLRSLSDDELLRRVVDLTQQSRRVEADLVVHLAPHLTPESREAVLARAAHKSRRQVEELVAELAPGLEAPSLIRRLPQRTPPAARSATVAVAPAMPPRESRRQLCSNTVGASTPITDAPPSLDPPLRPSDTPGYSAPHHRRPFAHGGDHTVENLGLVCRGHNGRLAEQDYGRAAIDRRRRQAEPSGPRGPSRRRPAP